MSETPAEPALVDIHDTLQNGIANTLAQFTDPSAMAPSATVVFKTLSSLHDLIQAAEIIFTAYQTMRCDPNFDIEVIDEDHDQSEIFHQRYEPLEKRVKALALIDANSKLIETMRLFTRFRNWSAHKMTVTFMPAIYHESLAQGLLPLVQSMHLYVHHVCREIQHEMIDWLMSKVPRTHDRFTEETTMEFADMLATKARSILKPEMTLPSAVTAALSHAKLWPYQKAGTKEATIFYDDVSSELKMIIGSIPTQP